MSYNDKNSYNDKTDKESSEDILAEARERFETASTNDMEQRDRVNDDIEFAFDPEQQWDTYVKDNRPNQPCLTYNKIEPAIDQIVGDQRKTRLGIKVMPTEKGDTGTAKVLAGLIRNIENQSDAETVYDEQFEQAVAGGMGCFRVLQDYNNDDAFDQDAIIDGFRSPASQVWFDPTANKWHKQDGDYMLVTDWVSKDTFERQWPDETPASWSTLKESEFWNIGHKINVAEYYRKKWVEETLLQFSDGRVAWKHDVDKVMKFMEADGLTVENERIVKSYKIEWWRLSGFAILEGPIEYDWKYFPIVPVYGKRRIIKNREHYKGITRNARDPQKSYNYQRSSIVEAALMTPKTPYLVTMKMIEPFKRVWDTIQKKNRPWVPFAADPKMPNGPIRQDFQQIPATLVTLTQQDSEDIQATTGIHDPSLGQGQGAQQSGAAIGAVQGQGDIGSFRYVDNLSKSIAMLGKILIDIIPTIYDTQRTIRIIGEDATEDWIEINNGEYDLENGKYDVVVNVGPTQKTEREAASRFLEAVVPASPMLQELAMDIVFKYQDIPGAQEIHDRIRQSMVSSGRVPPANEEEQQWAPQGPSESEQLMMRERVAMVLNQEADTAEKVAKVQQIIADTYKKQMEGEEIAVEIGSDAVIGEMMSGQQQQPMQQPMQQPQQPMQQGPPQMQPGMMPRQ